MVVACKMMLLRLPRRKVSPTDVTGTDTSSFTRTSIASTGSMIPSEGGWEEIWCDGDDVNVVVDINDDVGDDVAAASVININCSRVSICDCVSVTREISVSAIHIPFKKQIIKMNKLIRI